MNPGDLSISGVVYIPQFSRVHFGTVTEMRFTAEK